MENDTQSAVAIQVMAKMPQSKITHAKAKEMFKDLQAKFDRAGFEAKIEIFKQASQNIINTPLLDKEQIRLVNSEFCQTNWRKLIYLIRTVAIGKRIYAILRKHPENTADLWTTVAALQTIRIWNKEKTIDTMSAEYKELTDYFQASLNPAEIIIAQNILEKM